MFIKKILSLVLLLVMVASLASCDNININFGHKQDDSPTDEIGDNENSPEPTIYVYSVLSKSIHLLGCYHIKEIKEDYRKEHKGDPTSLLEKGYTLCKDCFPPEVEEEPEEEEEENKIPKEEATYLINSSSMKVHKLDCYHIAEMSEKNIKYTDLTLEELLELEHIPCSTCLPEEAKKYKEEQESKNQQ